MKELSVTEAIHEKIYTIRNTQIMLDVDLAELYGVEVKRLNEQVKRNIERFPENFRIQLTNEELKVLRSQIATLEKAKRGRHRKYNPYGFTEQGVAMLSSILHSNTAIEISIKIINAFVEMRHFIHHNAQIFTRLENIEFKQTTLESETNKNFEKVFKALDQKDAIPQQGIFFDGQVYDAYTFAGKLIKSAVKSLVLIDNYIDDTVLTLFTKRNSGVSVEIYTKEISRNLRLDLDKYNQQYSPINLTKFTKAHDRFIIIDGVTLYHLGASLKDLGKKWFAFTKLEIDPRVILEKLKTEKELGF